MNEFLLSDIIRILKINRETVREWVNRGFINPSRTKGKKKYFDVFSLYQIMAFKNLVESGLSRKLVANIVCHFDWSKSEGRVHFVFGPWGAMGFISIDLTQQKFEVDQLLKNK